MHQVDSENDFDEELQSLIGWEKEKESGKNTHKTEEEWNDDDNDLPF